MPNFCVSVKFEMSNFCVSVKFEMLFCTAPRKVDCTCTVSEKGLLKIGYGCSESVYCVNFVVP